MMASSFCGNLVKVIRAIMTDFAKCDHSTMPTCVKVLLHCQAQKTVGTYKVLLNVITMPHFSNNFNLLNITRDKIDSGHFYTS